jgi:RNA polymerase-binding transcription factor DksA
MEENQTIQLVEIPIGEQDGTIWNRLHAEREDTCETLARMSGANCGIYRELLQARLRKLDDALDDLMAGSYGVCSQCRQPINETRLDVDPAASRCVNCSGISKAEGGRSSAMDLVLENLSPFDTILLRTRNSDYRILLLDPKTGRALVEGGSYLIEPSEAVVRGSAVPGSPLKVGVIGMGTRLEMWINERIMRTSPITSVELKHNGAAESLEVISAALR